jgi:kynureninase
MDDSPSRTDEAHALGLDARDPMAGARDGFIIPENTVYMLGNSLGLMPKASEEAVERVLEEWRKLGIGGWLGGGTPWFWLAERIGERAAPLVGAGPGEVICTGTTTFNIHSLVSTFYRPEGVRTKILACSSEFPSDIYALKSQIALRGLDWRDHLVLIGTDRDGIVLEDDIIQAMTAEVALVHLSSVLFRSGQLLDMERLTAAAHEHGIVIGFDCSHSAGVVPHRFDEWDVDFAMWCGYKYLCGGPGAPAFIYVNRRHFDRGPGLAGWFGYVKERQFDLDLDFEHARCAGGWQVSSPGILGAAALEGALSAVGEYGMDAVRERSLGLTEYLIYLVDQQLSEEPFSFRVVTPREDERRGGHVAVSRGADALRIKEALVRRGVVTDFRPPDVIRIAPSPLYSTFHDVWTVVNGLGEIIDSRDYIDIPEERGLIS